MPGERINVFISYSHQDTAIFSKLVAGLASLREDGLLAAWSDLEIRPGDVWRDGIIDQLDTADLVLAFVSPAFLASRFCMGAEMRRALTRHQLGFTRIVPIIVAPCAWMDTDLAMPQALPHGGTPLTTAPDPVATLEEVISALRRLITTMRLTAPALNENLNLFSCADLMRLSEGARNSIRVIEQDIGMLPQGTAPLDRLFALDDLKRRRARYEAEFQRRCMDV